ncbi:MAG: bacteriophage Gp15 family protein [Bacteroides sp.]|nr:bacteriophage Gp15 family protein [Bacteroides sp.]
MKLRFYYPLPKKAEFEGKRYRLRLTVANVLRYIELCDEPEGLTFSEITEIGFGWLVGGGKLLPLHKKAELLEKLFKEYINPPARRLLKNKNSKSAVSFSHDSGFIYSAFMEAYGIDLWEQAPKMHWCKFLALFEGLPEDCLLKQIMGIRAQTIPALNGHNQKEIQRITELKTLYALPTKTSEEDAQGGWEKLFDFLERRAKE